MEDWPVYSAKWACWIETVIVIVIIIIIIIIIIWGWGLSACVLD